MKLMLEVTEEEMQALQRWADRRSLTVDQFALMALVGRHPESAERSQLAMLLARKEMESDES